MRHPNLPAAASNAIRDAVMLFNGGLDQETPAWSVKAGHVREANNYEQSIEGGYQDIQGYERFDGRTSPSTVGYSILDVTISGSIEAGDTITGATSGATAEVVAVVTSETPNYLVITRISGTFQNAEDLEVSASVEGVAASTAQPDAAETSLLHAQYTNLAADAYRADIGVVPGAGRVRGIWMLNGDVYAFRNNAGNTACVMHKQSTSGWTAVDLGETLSFTSGGTYDIAEGDTITGATSSATATVQRVIITSGSFAAGDAAGRLILASVSGTFQAENLDVGGNANVATIAGDSAAITLSPDGSYRFYNSNFADPGGVQRMYGCDGVNLGFEFDGTTYVPIPTGMTVDTPDHVIVHRNHLFFAFDSNLQHSGVGTPYSWTIVSGAGALVTDGDITALQREPGVQGNATLLVANRNRLNVLYGTSSADWNLVTYRDEVGAFEGTMQQVGSSIFLDDRGVTVLRTAQEFGNFQHSTLSTKIQTYINSSRGLAQSSCIVRNKNQYRIFFSDNTALYITMKGNKVAAMMPITLEHPVECIVSQETTNGTEQIYFGSDDGYVYQMERGTSFDGEPISAFLRLHYTNDGIRTLKDYMHSVTIEARGTGYAEIGFGYELGYGDEDIFQPVDVDTEIEFSTDARWDDGGATWDTLFWDGRTLQPTTGLDFRGAAENVGFLIRKNSDYFSPVRLTGVHYRYQNRRPMR